LKVFVTGAAGMVGRALQQLLPLQWRHSFSYDHRSLDISDRDRVIETLRHDQPDVVINCAAWTDVDGCELDKERAYAANAEGPENLARASREIGAGFVTISTDYVFDGEKDGFYTQRDQPGPQSIYGLAKLEGERRAQLAYARAIVVRTGFIFGSGGTNFLSTIVERARRGDKLKAIRDAYGTPTYALDLAGRLRELAQQDLPGVFHVVNAGPGVSYEEFARAALDLSGYDATKLESVATDSLKRPAPRPRNSRLQCLFSEKLGLAPLPFWRDSLKDFVALDSRLETAAKG
jgi:dTDP-4-dehydrorhamnose reductase